MASLSTILIGGLTLIAGGILLATGISAGLGARLLLTGALTLLSAFMTAPTGRGGVETSPTYGWGYLSNRAARGSPIPVIYGEHLVAPAVISVNLKTSSNRLQILHVLLAIGHGPIEAVHSVRVNDTPIEAFSGIEAVTDRLGESDQETIPDFNQVGAAYEANTALGNTGSHTHVMRAAADEVVLALAWPGGFYEFEKDGSGLDDVDWTGKVEYRAYDSTDNGAWAALSPPTSDPDWKMDNAKAGTWNRREKTQSRFDAQIRLTFDGQNGRPARGRYQIRLTASNKESPRSQRAASLVSVIEVNNDQRAYPGIALLALKIPAQAQLSDGIPRITCVVKGRKCYDPRTGLTEWTQNPIVCARDFVLNATYGLGRYYTSSDIDDGVGGTWRDAMDYCDETVTPVSGGSAEVRHRRDFVIDIKAPGHEHLARIVESARCSVYDAEEALRIGIDRDSASVRSFECRMEEPVGNRVNILDEGGVSTLTERRGDATERWTEILCTYVDEAWGWKPRTFRIRDTYVNVGAISGGPFQAGEKVKGGTSGAVGRITFSAATGTAYVTYTQDDGATEFQSGETLTGQTSGASCTTSSAPYFATPERRMEIHLIGVTRRSEAMREARHALQLAHRTPRFPSWGVFLGDLDVLPGDVVDVTADSTFLAYTAKECIVLACGFDAEGRGRIDAREHHADTFVDNIDTTLEDVTAFQPGGEQQGGGVNDTPSKPAGGTGSNSNAGNAGPPAGSSSGTGSSAGNSGSGTTSQTPAPPASNPPPSKQTPGATNQKTYVTYKDLFGGPLSRLRR